VALRVICSLVEGYIGLKNVGRTNHGNLTSFIIRYRFRSTSDTYRADEAIDFSELGQLLASQIGLMAEGASPRLDPG
jgi:ABC-type polysaccharide/polyol phosphate transport system ATPase subunit